jgi:hypothetical protein
MIIEFYWQKFTVKQWNKKYESFIVCVPLIQFFRSEIRNIKLIYYCCEGKQKKRLCKLFLHRKKAFQWQQELKQNLFIVSFTNCHFPFLQTNLWLSLTQFKKIIPSCNEYDIMFCNLILSLQNNFKFYQHNIKHCSVDFEICWTLI